MSHDDAGVQLKKRHMPPPSTSPEDVDTSKAPMAGAGLEPGNARASQHQSSAQALHLDAGLRSPHQYQAAACSRRVLLPSSTAWRALLGGPLLVWFLCTGLGMLQFRGLPSPGHEVQHLMDWFDDVFRALGPLLPLLPLLLRWAAVDGPGCMMAAGRLLRLGAGGAGGPRPRAPRATATMPWACLAAYAAIAAARVALYLVHRALQQRQRLAHAAAWSGDAEGGYVGGAVGSAPASELVPPTRLGGWVSDHVFLAASVLACLQLELVCSVSDVVKLEVEGAGLLREFCSACALLLSAALAGSVCLDMYFTCRYYHLPAESAAGLLAGLVLFQVPVLTWLWLKRPRQG